MVNCYLESSDSCFTKLQPALGLRVVLLSLDSSGVMQKKTVRKKWPCEILGAGFFVAVFFRVTLDVPSERRTNRSLTGTEIVR